MAKKQTVALPGSERHALAGAHEVSSVDPNEQIDVTVKVRPDTPLDRKTITQQGRQKSTARTHMSREEFERRHGAQSADIETVKSFAREHGLTVKEIHAGERKIVLSGKARAFSTAFDVELKYYDHPHGRYRGHLGSIHVPASLSSVVQGVFGLDNRPQAKPHFRRGKATPHAAPSGYLPTQMGQFYTFPPGDGQGQTIGIIELGGGYDTADFPGYFKQLGVAQPRVVNVSVDGGKDIPGQDPQGADGEVMLDIEVAGAIAPQAMLVVYFAPNTDRGFLDAITAAVHDNTYKPSILSISWGGPESSWTAQAIEAMDQAFQAAAALGVTVCVAAGDDGSSDGVNDGKNHVDFPASSPHVLACGGTRLEASGSSIINEVVWNEGLGNGATGGGVSDVFELPEWQGNAGVPMNSSGKPGRGVPDVAGDADPQTGYQVVVDGQSTVIGGTSAVAPLWAGLIARLNQALGQPVGYLTPLLYALPSTCFQDIRDGNNGTYKAGPGWDPCTGLGTPNGTTLLQSLRDGSSGR